MEDPRYRRQPLPAALNVRRRIRRKWRQGLTVWLIGICLLSLAWLALVGNDRLARKPADGLDGKPGVVESPPDVMPQWETKLAETRVETALAKLEQNRPDEALAVLVTALRGDPHAVDARQLAQRILKETTWHFPVMELHHPAAVDRIAYSPSHGLWVALAGEFPTLVRWDMTGMRIASVLFPLKDGLTRSLVVDPTGRRLVVERAGVLLLCDALSLKPLRDLGRLPEAATPSSVIVFSADGLLMAHLSLPDPAGSSWIWQIRDTLSGEILRASEPAPAGTPLPLSAHLSRGGLVVLREDGSTVNMPASPVEPEVVTPAPAPVKLLHACHAEDGKTALVLEDRGPHQAPVLAFFPEGTLSAAGLEAMALLDRFPFSRDPGIWTGLMRDAAESPVFVDGTGLGFTRENTAPVFTQAAITAVAASGSLSLIGGEDGSLGFMRRLPLPRSNEASDAADQADEEALAAFEDLTAALTGVLHEEGERHLVLVDADERRRRFDACDFAALRRLFPSLDFLPLIEAMAGDALRKKSSADIGLLEDRLARANPGQDAPPAASALHAALAGEDPARLRESLEAAENVPPLVRKLAESRIAWLEDRRGDAMAAWPDEFPVLAEIRLREDWDGWEQVDFKQALEAFRKDMEGELSKLALPKEHDVETRRELLERLTDPETLRGVGRRRLAKACLQAALVFSGIKTEAEATLVLASIARAHGEAPEACLRAEARAFSNLGDHTKAHDRWILLLTGYPVEVHEPADYADAAYTAFEVSDARQAIEILNSGLQRFPEDAEFALRAGWIALLTGNPERAYAFLLSGRRVGFPGEKTENATLLLTIAAAQAGQTEDALAFFDELIAINPAWEEPKTIEDLDWPDELKAPLRQLTW